MATLPIKSTVFCGDKFIVSQETHSATATRSEFDSVSNGDVVLFNPVRYLSLWDACLCAAIDGDDKFKEYIRPENWGSL